MNEIGRSLGSSAGTTSAEHTRAAEEILSRYAGRDPGNVPSVVIALAQVHASLALLAEIAPSESQRYAMRRAVRQIIDSYALTMVGSDALESVDACADDVLHEVLGWPVTYQTVDRGSGGAS